MGTAPKFGSRAAPLRASSLPGLVKCPKKHMLMSLGIIENRDSKAADTGSAVHAGAYEWHRTGDLDKAIEAMKSRLHEFPLADLCDAELSLRPYCADPRNSPEKVVQQEIEIELVLPCPGDDDIVIQGRLDQIRSDGCLWDIKNSEKRSGFLLVHYATYQLAVYAKAMGVQIGGIINPYGYRKRRKPGEEKTLSPNGVFYPENGYGDRWTAEHTDMLLNEIVHEVQRIRRGEVVARPGDHCDFCPAQNFIDCVRMQ